MPALAILRLEHVLPTGRADALTEQYFNLAPDSTGYDEKACHSGLRCFSRHWHKCET